MAHITLIRHAKAIEDKKTFKDLYRPVTKEGILKLLTLLETTKIKVNKNTKVYCSHSSRTVSTALVVMDVLNIPIKNLEIQSDLYDLSDEIIEKSIIQISKSNENIIVVGHNPSFKKILQSWTNDNRSIFRKSAIHQFEIIGKEIKYLSDSNGN